MRRLAAALVAAVLPLLAAACGGGGSGGGGSPTITVVVQGTDCPVKDITISPFTVQQDTSSGALHLNIEATVNCKGQPLAQKGVKLTFTIPRQTAPATAETDGSGHASTTPQNPDNKDLVGQSVGVAVTGENGSSYPAGSTTVTKAP